MMDHVLNIVRKIVLDHSGKDIKAATTIPVGGGCINDAHRLATDAGIFFIKYNNAQKFPDMFKAEARGLELLGGIESGSPVKVPGVIGTAAANNLSVLVLEFINSGKQGADFWETFGSGLAGLHQKSSKSGRFGLDHDNYIGSLPQINTAHNGWLDFFMACRIEPQLKMAIDQKRAGKELASGFTALYRHLQDFFPEEPPSLLHGDLWSGNFMTGSGGEAVIFDPAVYYGHRYMDLAMSRLFGGFDPAFYRAYHQTYPLDSSWENSMDIANLYPLMVHLNLFGESYLGRVEAILKRFG